MSRRKLSPTVLPNGPFSRANTLAGAMSPALGPPAPEIPAERPSRAPLHGRYTSLVPLEPSHSGSLFDALAGERNAALWTYMPWHPVLDKGPFEEVVRGWSVSTEYHFYTILTGPASDPASKPAGIASYLNIVPDHFRIEIGAIMLGAGLSRTRAATEAFFLMIRHAIEELGYHRVEWKANNLNEPSKAAAARLGFAFEGVFRNHLIVKGRVRDTAWFSITAAEWPGVKDGLEMWLSEDNFDAGGLQIRTLKECRQGQQTA